MDFSLSFSIRFCLSTLQIGAQTPGQSVLILSKWTATSYLLPTTTGHREPFLTFLACLSPAEQLHNSFPPKTKNKHRIFFFSDLGPFRTTIGENGAVILCTHIPKHSRLGHGRVLRMESMFFFCFNYAIKMQVRDLCSEGTDGMGDLCL